MTEPDRLQLMALDQRPGAKRFGVVAQLIEQLREAAFHEPAPDALPDIIVALPRHVALLVAHRLELTEERFAVRREFDNEIEGARELMKDEYLRMTQATFDLELLLKEFIGRPFLSMEEVREQRERFESRAEPKPFIRHGARAAISPELQRSLRSGRIGTPREPGEEG